MKIYKGIEGFEEFADYLELDKTERFERIKLLNESFMPFQVTEYYANLIKSIDLKAQSQLLNIILPVAGEKKFVGRFDPYGNVHTRQGEAFLQHKYERTLLLHMYDYCISNCQFCYKVNEIRHENRKEKQFSEKIISALNYLTANKNIDNVLFSGGDPAAMPPNTLIECLSSLISSPNIRIVRFATKVLAYNPSYFLNKDILKFLFEINKKSTKQITIIAQINHPNEISSEFNTVLRELQETNTQIRAQPALIKGVNDDSETLAELQRKCINNRIINYYITAFMPVRGVEQYALKLHEAFKIVNDAKGKLNGLEKQAIFLTSHDFGKFEICGFLPSINNPQKIILKWHQAAMKQYLPIKLIELIPTQPGELLYLNYSSEGIYCIDHLFLFNELPYFNIDNSLVYE